MFHPDKMLWPEKVWLCEVQLGQRSQAKHPFSALLDMIYFYKPSPCPAISENDIKMHKTVLYKNIRSNQGRNVLVRLLSLNAGK